MDKFERIKYLIAKNNTDLNEMGSIIDELSKNDINIENENLKNEVLELKNLLENNNKKIAKLEKTNEIISFSLKEIIYKNKNSFINSSKKELHFYFKSNENNISKLEELEQNYKKRFNKIKNDISQEIFEEKTDFDNELNSFSTKVYNKLNDVRKEIEEKRNVLVEDINKNYEELLQDPMPTESIVKKSKFFNFEMTVGNKLVNAVGMILILLGVVFGLQYTYTNFLKSDELRSVLCYLLGIGFIFVGEFLQRKEKNIFAIGLSAGGIGILFASTAISYFILNVLNLYLAIFICILITFIAFFMSMRYDSKTIALFAYFGGYLPIFAIQKTEVFIYSALIYFFILNTFTLILSSFKKWQLIKVISFFINLICTIFILIYGLNKINYLFAIVYVSITFIMFIGIILYYDFKNKENVTNLEIVVLYLNTIFNCLFIFLILLYEFNTNFDFYGLIIIGFFIIYFIAAKFSEKYFSHDKKIVYLFYIATLTLSCLIVPVQLGLDYLFLGWTIQGVSLYVVGLIKKDNWILKSGKLLTSLSIIIFYFNDLSNFDFAYIEKNFIINYSVITVSCLIVLASYLYMNIFKDENLKKDIIYNAIKYFDTINFPIFLVILTKFVFLNSNHLNKNITIIIYCYIFLVYGFLMKNIKLINNNKLKLIYSIFEIIGITSTFLINLIYFNKFSNDIILYLLIFLDFLAVFLLYKNLKTLYTIFNKFDEGIVYLIPSIYSLILFINFVYVFLNLNFYSLVISLIVMLASLVWIIFGFAFHIKLLRIFGLYISLISTAKLFLLDLVNLNSEIRIISYFIFGGVLIAISFVYQYFNKKLIEE